MKQDKREKQERIFTRVTDLDNAIYAADPRKA